MQLATLRHEAIGRLEREGIEDATICVDWLIGDALGISRSQIFSQPAMEIGVGDEHTVWSGVVRRASGEPIQYIIGWTEFYGLRIDVDPRVLIPRPETEMLVDEILRLTDAVSAGGVVDVGTGSGCIALAVRSRRPDFRIVASDVSAGVLTVARENSERLCLPITLVLADMESARSMAKVGSDFDVMVSNPPYIPTAEFAVLQKGVLGHEPTDALCSGVDPLRYYHAIIDRALEHVRSGGSLVMEVHSDYAAPVERLAREKGLTNIVVRSDLAGLPRMVAATVGQPPG